MLAEFHTQQSKICKCIRCEADVAYRTAKREYCDGCRTIRHRERSRKGMERVRRGRDIPQTKGVQAKCADCDQLIVKANHRHIRCEPCAAAKNLAAANARSQGRSADPRARDLYNRWLREKRRADPKWALNRRIATYMAKSLRGRKDGRKWQELVGYTVDQLAAHLERQFLPGMTWGNRDKWHIDHIVPLVSFEFTSPEDDGFKAAWALTNLRPLWSGANVRKGGKRQHLL